jgi:O-antigen/teichoic acid export membrane protein
VPACDSLDAKDSGDPESGILTRVFSYLKRRLSDVSAASVSGTTALNLITILCGVGSGVTLARSLGPANRGELAAALLWPGLFVLFADMGLGFAFAYGAAKWKDRLNDLWSLSLVLGLLLGAVAMLAGWLILPRLSGHLSVEGHLAMKVALGAIPFILMSGYEAYVLLGLQHVADYNAARVTAPAANLITVVLVAVSGRAGVLNYSLAYLATQVVAFLFCTLLFYLRMRPRFSMRFDLVTSLFSYGIRTQLGSLAGQANLRLDQSIMSLWVKPESLGFYVVAVSISAIAAPLLNALAVFALPGTAHADSGNHAGLVTARHLKQALLFSLPVTLLWIAIMPWILPGFFGRDYVPAVLSAQILTVASLIQGLNAILGNSLRGLGRPGLTAVAEGGGMVVTAVLLFLLLPLLGIAGAAITSVGAYAAVAVMQFFFAARSAGLTSAELARATVAHDVFDFSRILRRAGASR